MKRSNAHAGMLLCLCLAGAPLAADIIYYHTDAAGSPLATTNINGAVRWRARYRPFGDRDQSATHYAKARGNLAWYAGHAFDEATGLSYMQARYYNPVLGRFISPDPLGVQPADPLTFNRYAYARNNPYRYRDPDGRESVAIMVKGGGAPGVGLNFSSGIYLTFPLFDDVPWDAGLMSSAAVVTGVEGAATVNLFLFDGGRENLEGSVVTVNTTVPLTGVVGPAFDAEVMFDPVTGRASGSSLGAGLAAVPSASVAYGNSSIDLSLRDVYQAFFGATDEQPVFQSEAEAAMWFDYISG